MSEQQKKGLARQSKEPPRMENFKVMMGDVSEERYQPYSAEVEKLLSEFLPRKKWQEQKQWREQWSLFSQIQKKAGVTPGGEAGEKVAATRGDPFRGGERATGKTPQEEKKRVNRAAQHGSSPGSPEGPAFSLHPYIEKDIAGPLLGARGNLAHPGS